MNNPRDAKYTKDHEWVRIDGDVATMGIADYAQSQLGDMVFVGDLLSVGLAVVSAARCGLAGSREGISWPRFSSPYDGRAPPLP